MDSLNEFWYCVSPQENLPLYESTNFITDTGEELLNFIRICKQKGISESNLKDILKDIILSNPSSINSIRTLVGVSDKRLYLELTFIFNRVTDENSHNLLGESRANLKKHSTSFFINKIKNHPNNEIFAKIVAQYFIDKGLYDILKAFISVEDEVVINLFNYLISPKESQQKEAKYRGHGAEMAVAKVLVEFGVNIEPSDKAIDTMGSHDPNVDLSCMKIVDRDADDNNIHSFDIIVKDSEGNIRVLIQSLIHSSDPGQYGVDKSNETVAIMNLVNQYNSINSHKPVSLWGSVDGVGFIENPNGTIAKMLRYFDNFFQIDTLFKIPIGLYRIGLINNIIGISFDTEYFEPHVVDYFMSSYLSNTSIKNMTGQNLNQYKTIKAGKAILVIN